MMNRKTMKNKKIKKEPPSEVQISELSIVPGISVIAGIMAVIFAALFFVLWRADHITLYFAGFLSPSSQYSDEGNEGDIIKLPMQSNGIVGDDLLFTPDFAAVPGNLQEISAVLHSVRQHDTYEQTFSLSYREGKPAQISFLRDGNKYRIEGEGLLVVCDGNTVYMRKSGGGLISFENRWNVDEGMFSAEHEIGIPSLEEIVEGVENSETVPDFNFDDGAKSIMLSNINRNGVQKAYILSYETGIVRYAAAVSDDGVHLYQCESVKCTLDPVFAEDAFRIPMS